MGRVLVVVDQSGSVSDQLLAKLFAAMEQLSKHLSFYVLPFDQTIDEESMFHWRKGARIPPTRVRSGGTCFDAPTQFFNDHYPYFVGMIIATDMECSAPIKARGDRLWVTDLDGERYDKSCNVSQGEPLIVLE